MPPTRAERNRGHGRRQPRNSPRSIRSMVLHGTSNYRGLGRAGTRDPDQVGGFKLYNSKDPFKPKYKCKLHYTESFTFTTGTAGVFGTEQSMRLNSLFDPNLTGTGHQPYGFDQLSALYGSYLVEAVEFWITWTDPSADGIVVGALIQANKNANSVTGMTIDRLAEIPGSAVEYVNNTGSQITSMHCKMPIRKLFGLTKQQFEGNLSDYASPIGTNPNQPCYVRFSAGSARGNAGDTIVGKIHIIFHTRMFDRLVWSQS